jgi:adenosylcobinamide amidohydrolase
MRQFDIIANRVRLILEGNVLAVLADTEMNTVSGAIYNGGFRKTKAVVNVEVSEGYGDRRLHDNPAAFVEDSVQKLHVQHDFVGLITAAKINNFSLVRKSGGDLAVGVVATAGCSHSESAGEEISVQPIAGTINVIVVIDGNPSQSCMVAALATAVEAKAAAMRELDIRSRYSGDLATGTITDSVVVAATNLGQTVCLAGPASRLGQLIAQCARKAVKEAITNQGECVPWRSVVDRLRERHLSLEKLGAELSKLKSLGMSAVMISVHLDRMLKNDPIFALFVMMATRIDEDADIGLLAPEFGTASELGKQLGFQFSEKTQLSSHAESDEAEIDLVDLPRFLKQVLIAKLKGRS